MLDLLIVQIQKIQTGNRSRLLNITQLSYFMRSEVGLANSVGHLGYLENTDDVISHCPKSLLLVI